MGISLRIFFLTEDGSLKRFPLARWERLLRLERGESLPEYAGKRLRYAEVAVELEDRTPVAILRTAYSILSLDSEGRVDPKELAKEISLALETPSPRLSKSSSRVVNAEHLFAKKRLDDQYRWRPSPEIDRAIMEAVFGQKLP
jgi:hypothetical protein